MTERLPRVTARQIIRVLERRSFFSWATKRQPPHKPLKTERSMDIAQSVHGVPVRLTYERWYHIIENHDELASYFHDVLDVIENPKIVVRGSGGALKAARNMGKKNGWQWYIEKYRKPMDL
jgi:hypothetical protein